MQRGLRESENVRERAMMYRVLANYERLNILITIAEHSNPGIAFNDLARETGIEKGLLAYHLGVLKSIGLIENEYQREGRKFSRYYLTEKGLKVIKEFKLDEPLNSLQETSNNP